MTAPLLPNLDLTFIPSIKAADASTVHGRNDNDSATIRGQPFVLPLSREELRALAAASLPPTHSSTNRTTSLSPLATPTP